MIKKNDKIITISVDDFGINKQTNENIFQLIEKEKVDRAEIMIGEKNITTDQVSRLLASKIKLDIHLHLAKDQLDFWQTNPRKLEKSALKRIFWFIFRYFFGENKPKEIEKEWQNQISEFQKLFGKFPDGLSSHEHIHFFPSYFQVALRLARKNKIPYLRLGKYRAKEKGAVCFILNSLRKIDLLFLKKSGIISSDFLVSFDWLTNFDEFLKNCPAGKDIELVFHPEKDSEFEFLSKLQ
jgi:predicted glycoside hydrolase/deacetylase ChbG (UPF0249 family)